MSVASPSATGKFPDVHSFNTVFDVVIVGAGIQGSATAYQCVKQGLKTLLLEQFSLPHSRGSSHGQSRIIRYAYEQPHYADMMSEAYPMWKQLEREANTKLYKKTGLLTVSLHQEAPLYHSSLYQMRRFGRAYKVLDHATVKRDFPELDFPPEALVYMDYDAGILRADRGLRAFQTEFVKRGGDLRDEEPVLEIVPGLVAAVRTNKGTYHAKSLILTPGGWASKLLRPLGLDPPLKVIRINVPYWPEKEKDSMNNMPNIIVECPGGQHIYGLQSLEYPGLTKVAYHGGFDFVDPDYRDDVPGGKKEEVEFLKTAVSRHLPGLKNQPTVMETCMYTCTPDDEFIVDRHPVYPNIIVCCGCSGHGYKLAPPIGKILCSLAVGKQPHIDISALSFRRFKNSAMISSAKL